MRPISTENHEVGARAVAKEGQLSVQEAEAQAERMVDQLMDSIRLDRTKVPNFIGTRGANVRKIKELSGVRKLSWIEDRGVVEIWGSREQIDKAKEIIEQVVRGDERALGRTA